MANRLIGIGDVEKDFLVDSGSAIVQMEVGAWDSTTNAFTSTSLSSGEEWNVEQADLDIPDGERVWSAVHNTGATNFNGLNNDNRVIVFATSPNYIYRVRKAGGTSLTTNLNVAISWDIGSTRRYI